MWVLNEIFFGRPKKYFFCPLLSLLWGLSPIFGLAPFIRVGTGVRACIYPFFHWLMLHLPLPFSSHRPCSIFSFYGPTFSPPPYSLLPIILLRTPKETCDAYSATPDMGYRGGFDTLETTKTAFVQIFVSYIYFSANSLLIHLQSHLCTDTNVTLLGLKDFNV